MGVRPHGEQGYVLALDRHDNTCVADNIYEARGLDLTLPVKDVPRIMSNSNEPNDISRGQLCFSSSCQGDAKTRSGDIRAFTALPSTIWESSSLCLQYHKQCLHQSDSWRSPNLGLVKFAAVLLPIVERHLFE